MRNPHCIYCGELTTMHLNRGYKHEFIRHNGGRLHVRCIDKYKEWKKSDNRRKDILRKRYRRHIIV
jgi:hypothetical protein